MDRMLRCLLIQHAECEKYVVARNRALGMVVRFDSVSHCDIYKETSDHGDFKPLVMDMLGWECTLTTRLANPCHLSPGLA